MWHYNILNEDEESLKTGQFIQYKDVLDDLEKYPIKQTDRIEIFYIE